MRGSARCGGEAVRLPGESTEAVGKLKRLTGRSTTPLKRNGLQCPTGRSRSNRRGYNLPDEPARVLAAKGGEIAQKLYWKANNEPS